MVWQYGGEGATHKVWPGSMQRLLRNQSLWTTDGRMDGQRMMDTCAMTVALLRKSSRAKNLKSRNGLKFTTHLANHCLFHPCCFCLSLPVNDYG